MKLEHSLVKNKLNRSSWCWGQILVVTLRAFRLAFINVRPDRLLDPYFFLPINSDAILILLATKFYKIQCSY